MAEPRQGPGPKAAADRLEAAGKEPIAAYISGSHIDAGVGVSVHPRILRRGSSRGSS